MHDFGVFYRVQRYGRTNVVARNIDVDDVTMCVKSKMAAFSPRSYSKFI